MLPFFSSNIAFVAFMYSVCHILRSYIIYFVSYEKKHNILGFIINDVCIFMPFVILLLQLLYAVSNISINICVTFQ